PVSICEAQGLHGYGSEQAWVRALPGNAVWLCEGLTEAMVRFAARYEYAITVEDVLARRSRLLFLDAQLAQTVAERVAQILFEETALDPQLQEFLKLSQHYKLV
ncbi:MAG: FAD-dependent oxidoreductase, partial [Limnohabitans sp.]|nr:FAD-dependent oxidoreductase [Limnohabitans sp.]